MMQVFALFPLKCTQMLHLCPVVKVLSQHLLQHSSRLEIFERYVRFVEARIPACVTLVEYVSQGRNVSVAVAVDVVVVGGRVSVIVLVRVEVMVVEKMVVDVEVMVAPGTVAVVVALDVRVAVIVERGRVRVVVVRRVTVVGRMYMEQAEEMSIGKKDARTEGTAMWSLLTFAPVTKGGGNSVVVVVTVVKLRERGKSKF